jgi:pyridoxine 5-phosphate synthase
VDEIVELLKSYPDAELNIEGNPFFDYMPIVRKAMPTQCTLVPDTPEAFTSDHGWDVTKDAERLKPIIAELKSLGCRVSLFMDAKPEVMDAVAVLGVDRVELYTEPYAAAFAARDEDASKAYEEAARAAHDAGLAINAGHDLNLENLPPFLRDVPWVQEVSIGHALIADALEFGLAATVNRYLRACGHAVS